MVQFYHSSTSKWSKNFLSKLKRHYYVTPTSYIELITTLKSFLMKREKKSTLIFSNMKTDMKRSFKLSNQLME